MDRKRFSEEVVKSTGWDDDGAYINFNSIDDIIQLDHEWTIIVWREYDWDPDLVWKGKWAINGAVGPGSTEREFRCNGFVIATETDWTDLPLKEWIVCSLIDRVGKELGLWKRMERTYPWDL